MRMSIKEAQDLGYTHVELEHGVASMSREEYLAYRRSDILYDRIGKWDFEKVWRVENIDKAYEALDECRCNVIKQRNGRYKAEEYGLCFIREEGGVVMYGGNIELAREEM